MFRLVHFHSRFKTLRKICMADSKRYAGHNKWANIKHTKASKDAQKSTLFSKLNRQLQLAVQEGGSPDPNRNPKLHQVMEHAKRQSMPTMSIQNAIKLAANSKADTKEFLLEVTGPGGAVILVILLTDNFPKTKYDLTPIVRKSKVAALSDGNRWRHTFELKNVVEVLKPIDTTLEIAVEHALQIGAEDVNLIEDGEATSIFQFLCAMGQTRQVESELGKLQYKIHYAGIKYIPRTVVELKDEYLEALSVMYQKMDNHPDVIAIYDNIA